MYKICVVTATRAEYGVLKNVIRKIEEDDTLELCLVVTGTHLSQQYGYTIQEIYDDGMPVSEKIEILDESNDEPGIAKTMGNASIAFGEMFQRVRPDLLLVVGDRYELMPICQCAVIFRIPIAHISGGEITEGAVDDMIRHSITKLSQLHFPGCKEYRQRIIQMGEEPERVFDYGDIGVENIRKMQYLSKSELESDLKLSLDLPYACVTFHPVTQEKETAQVQIEELLKALEQTDDMQFIITKANADVGGKMINECIDRHVRNSKNCVAFDSLGIKRYLSLLKYSKFVIGNSSSGIIEAPAFGVPTVNIGDRQKGRLQADSVINCNPVCKEIVDAMMLARSRSFQEKAKHTKNPYGDGETSVKIVEEIKRYLEQKATAEKHFYDIDFDEKQEGRE